MSAIEVGEVWTATPWRDVGQALIERARSALEDVAARGLRAAAAREIAAIEATRDELRQAGLAHVARRFERLGHAARAGEATAGAALMEAYASVRVLERVLTLEGCAAALAAAIPPPASDAEA